MTTYWTRLSVFCITFSKSKLKNIYNLKIQSNFTPVHRNINTKKFLNSISFDRSLWNSPKSIRTIPKILFIMVRHKIPLCYRRSTYITKTFDHTKLCGKEFLYGLFRIPKRLNCYEMYVCTTHMCQYFCQWSMDVSEKMRKENEEMKSSFVIQSVGSSDKFDVV